MELRDYQKQALEALWLEMFKSNAALCCMPTGSGKTEVMMALIRRAMETTKRLRVVVLVNKVNLLEQTYRRFGKVFGYVDTGMYCGSTGKHQVHQKITIASIQSIHSVDLEHVHLVVLDEVHNVNEESGRYIRFIERNRAVNPNMKILAFTATPYRSTGYIYGKGKLFERIAYKRGLQETIADGFLVRPVLKRVDEQFDTSGLHIRMGEYRKEEVEALTSDEAKVIRQVRDALPRMAGRSKVVWACSSIKHCELVAKILNAEGEHALTLHSKMEDADSRASQNNFEKGECRHLVFVSIVSEGYDYPPIDCVVLMRPIRSPVLYVQTVGRGLRPSPGKADLLVLDYGGVVESVGPLDDPMVVTARGSGEDRNQVKVDMKFCPQCLSYVTKKAKECPDCHYVYPMHSSIEKLEDRAYSGGGLLKEPPKPQRIPVSGASMSSFMSKNGNECLKISYRPLNMFSPPINEYYVFDNQWAQTRMRKRLEQLGVDLAATLDEQVKMLITRKPTALVVLEEKYVKVVSVEFDQ